MAKSVSSPTKKADDFFDASTPAQELAPSIPIDDGGWRDMPEPAGLIVAEGTFTRAFPFDGSVVELRRANDRVEQAVWRESRRMNRQTGRWEPIAFWARRNAGGKRIDFEPVAYRKMVE